MGRRCVLPRRHALVDGVQTFGLVERSDLVGRRETLQGCKDTNWQNALKHPHRTASTKTKKKEHVPFRSEDLPPERAPRGKDPVGVNPFSWRTLSLSSLCETIFQRHESSFSNCQKIIKFRRVVFTRLTHQFDRRTCQSVITLMFNIRMI